MSVQVAPPIGAPTTIRQAHSYSMSELLDKIGEDPTFSTHILHIPRLAASRFKEDKLASGKGDVNYRVVVGYHVIGRLRQEVYAYVLHTSGVRNRVELRTKSNEVLDVTKRAEVDLIEPFKYIGHMDKVRGQQGLRFLVLFYFIKRGYLSEITFTSDGLNYLKQACTSIAKEMPNAGRRYKRVFRVSTTDAQELGAQTPSDFTTTTVKSESSAEDTRLEPPENDFIRAVGTLIKNCDHIGNSLVNGHLIVTQSSHNHNKSLIARSNSIPSHIPHSEKKRLSNSDLSLPSKRYLSDTDFERYQEFIRLRQLDADYQQLKVKYADQTKTFSDLQQANSRLQQENHNLTSSLEQQTVLLTNAKAAALLTNAKMEQSKAELAKTEQKFSDAVVKLAKVAEIRAADKMAMMKSRMEITRLQEFEQNILAATSLHTSGGI